jgi:hypothetical protein
VFENGVFTFDGSYSVNLPFDRMLRADSGWSKRIAGGWRVSGITTFATGIPVPLQEGKDVSLTGSIGTDIPSFTPGKILNDTNPRHESVDANGNVVNFYFPTTLFSTEAPGQIANANRRFFHGPGLNNWDMALLKDIRITENKMLELRFEAFNILIMPNFRIPTVTLIRALLA